MDSCPRHAHGVSRPLIGLTALLCGLTVADAAGQGNAETDRAALTTLYHATGGPSWTDSTNWLTDAPLSEWYGVYVDEAGRVRYVALRSNGLRGSLPAELADLAHLDALALSSNELSGPIPAAIGDLSRLEWLELYDNQLSGPNPGGTGQLGQPRHIVALE